MDHGEWVTIRVSAPLPDGTIRYLGIACDGRTLTLIECPDGDLAPGWSNPCQCWERDHPSERAGHCCFVGECVTGTVENRRVLLGSAAFLSEQGVDPGPLAVEADRLRADGATVVFVGADDQVAGIIAIADLIKQSTP